MSAMETTNTSCTTDILIVGAGPVGMTLALALRRAGVAVTIVDREPKTGQFTRAAVVWPRTLEVFDLLGIVGDWEAEGVPVHGFHLNIDGGEAAVSLSGIDSPHPFPLGIGQDKTEAMLDARLRASGADYRRGVVVTSVQLDADGATATLQIGGEGDNTDATETIRARWIVGCEGAKSVVRDAAGITRQGGQNAGVQIIQGDLRVQTAHTLPPGQAFVWSKGTRSLLLLLPLLLPLHKDGHYRVLIVRDDDGEHGEPTPAQIQEEARRLLPDLIVSDPLWCNRFRTQHQIADRYRQGRALICGDAAHVWVPIGGQGMNIGIQDAFDLGWKLAGVVGGTLPESVLDTYESERRPIGVANIALTEQMYGILVDAETPVAHVARRIFPHLVGLGPVQERAAARFSEVDFHYDASAIVADRGHGGASAGQRALDAYVARPATGDTAVRLFDLFRAGRWTALAWAMRTEDAEPVRRVLDALASFPIDRYVVDATTDDGVLTISPEAANITVLRDQPRFAAEAYGVHQAAVYLIRPDGVIGYRGDLDEKSLRGYCDGAFTAATLP